MSDGLNKEQAAGVIDFFHEMCLETWHESSVPQNEGALRDGWIDAVLSRRRYPAKAWMQAIVLMMQAATSTSKCPKLRDLTDAIEGLSENDDLSASDRAALKRHMQSQYARSDEAKAAAYEQIKQQKLKDLGVI